MTGGSAPPPAAAATGIWPPPLPQPRQLCFFLLVLVVFGDSLHLCDELEWSSTAEIRGVGSETAAKIQNRPQPEGSKQELGDDSELRRAG